MRQKWNKTDDVPADPGEGQPIPQKLVFYPDVTLRWKSIAPSRQAIDTYNNMPLSVDSTTIAYDNLGYIPQNGDPISSNFSTMSSTRPLNGNAVMMGHIYTPNEDKSSEYCTIRSSSGGTNAGSQTDITGRDPGSTTSLVRPKFRDKCDTCLRYVETVLCTISLACGLGNVYRLPQVVLAQGGLPFFVAYIILTLFIGLPLLILEIGLGQIVQEGFMKTWRAVPFFRGVGYIKFIAGCLLSIYYSLYVGLAIYYVIWFGKDSAPFNECREVRMGTSGYRAYGISGQQCVK
ncbi:Sodium:neurotransmitter symporter family [Popillia japonica]|uniref:Sodium:neurotransmitter symporter family n=1 Tax=Popillia japonica TaxID=7064 RepID=A0AAW1KST4_POPJA